MRPERANLGYERADLRPQRACIKPLKAVLGALVIPGFKRVMPERWDLSWVLKAWVEVLRGLNRIVGSPRPQRTDVL